MFELAFDSCKLSVDDGLEADLVARLKLNEPLAETVGESVHERDGGHGCGGQACAGRRIELIVVQMRYKYKFIYGPHGGVRWMNTGMLAAAGGLKPRRLQHPPSQSHHLHQ